MRIFNADIEQIKRDRATRAVSVYASDVVYDLIDQYEAALSAAEPVSANLNVFVCYDGVIFATENSAKEYCKDRNFALGGMGYNKKPLQGDFTHSVTISMHVDRHNQIHSEH